MISEIEWNNGGRFAFNLFIYLPIFLFNEEYSDTWLVWFIFFFCTDSNNSNIFSDSLSLINIGLFYESSPINVSFFHEFSTQWVREKRGNPFGAIAAKRDLIEISSEQTCRSKYISKNLCILAKCFTVLHTAIRGMAEDL